MQRKEKTGNFYKKHPLVESDDGSTGPLAALEHVRLAENECRRTNNRRSSCGARSVAQRHQGSHHPGTSGSQALILRQAQDPVRWCAKVNGTADVPAPHRSPRRPLVVMSASLSHINKSRKALNISRQGAHRTKGTTTHRSIARYRDAEAKHRSYHVQYPTHHRRQDRSGLPLR